MDDPYAYEAALEQQEEQKRLHKPMKDWFATREDLSELHGSFPLFWRDLATWAPWKEVKREYNRFLERKDVPAAVVFVPASANETQPQTAETSTSSSATAVAAAADTIANSEGGSVAESGSSAAQPAPARKRRRWGEASEGASAVSEPASAAVKKPSRWLGDGAAGGLLGAAIEVAPPTLPPMPTVRRGRCRWGQRAISAALALLPPGASQMQEALFVYRVRVEELQLKLALVPVEAKRQDADPNRSPSPEPEYDSNGKKLNGREQRLRKKFTEQRDRLVERMVDLNPALAGAAGPKFIRKLYIPWREYPNYNFIGLIIGPRGNTQKKLEKETNCKISIRGRGSGKEGKGDGSSRNRDPAEDNDEMHVMISGEKLAEVEQATALITDLLHPVDDDTNEWKKRQLMELAAINGTLRDLNAPCSRCGEPGHRHFECPYAEANAKRITVRCALCGDGSHVTSDCKLNSKGGADGGEGAGGGVKPVDMAMEGEYLSFMAEMGDQGAKDRLEAIHRAKGGEQGGSAPAAASGARAGIGFNEPTKIVVAPPAHLQQQMGTGAGGNGPTVIPPPKPMQIPPPQPVTYSNPMSMYSAPTTMPSTASSSAMGMSMGGGYGQAGAMPAMGTAEHAAWYAQYQAHAYQAYAAAASMGMAGYGLGGYAGMYGGSDGQAAAGYSAHAQAQAQAYAAQAQGAYAGYAQAGGYAAAPAPAVYDPAAYDPTAFAPALGQGHAPATVPTGSGQGVPVGQGGQGSNAADMEAGEVS